MSAKIVTIPGVERRDIGTDVPTGDVLQKAIEAGVTGAVIVGRDRAGQPYIASETADPDKVIGILMGAVATLSSFRVEHK